MTQSIKHYHKSLDLLLSHLYLMLSIIAGARWRWHFKPKRIRRAHQGLPDHILCIHSYCTPSLETTKPCTKRVHNTPAR
jgi:hypothetical protein